VRRLSWVAALLASGLTLADAMSAGVFVSVARRDISGKSCSLTNSLEIHADGRIDLTDESGATLAAAQLSAADLQAFESLLSDRTLLATQPDCVPAGADFPETEFAVEYSGQTFTVRVPAGCTLSPKMEALAALFDAVAQSYVPEK
jgi:hypothetical protein